MDGIPLGRVSQVIQITTTLEESGTSPERLLRRLNMPMWHDCQPDGFVPLSHTHTLMHHGARAVGAETFGARVMEHVPFQRMGAVGKLIAAAPTVYQALETAIRRLPTHATSRRWWFAEGRDEVWFCRGGDCVFDVGEGQMIQYALTGVVQVVRLAAGPGWRPSKVRVQAADTLGLETTDMFSEARILPDRAASAIAIPRSILSLPIRRSGRPNTSSDEISDAQFQASAPPDDLVGSLRQIVGTLLCQGHPQIRCAAEIAGLHLRALQRRLESEGVTYKQLVAEARYEAAACLLKEPDATVSEIAFDLGYTDVSHFSRAFHRWTGASPSAYRRLSVAN